MDTVCNGIGDQDSIQVDEDTEGQGNWHGLPNGVQKDFIKIEKIHLVDGAQTISGKTPSQSDRASPTHGVSFLYILLT